MSTITERIAQLDEQIPQLSAEVVNRQESLELMIDHLGELGLTLAEKLNERDALNLELSLSGLARLK